MIQPSLSGGNHSHDRPGADGEAPDALGRVSGNVTGENQTGEQTPENVARLKRRVQSLRKALESVSCEYSERGIALVSELEGLSGDRPTP
jgi:archaellum component FlaC